MAVYKAKAGFEIDLSGALKRRFAGKRKEVEQKPKEKAQQNETKQ